MPDKPPASFWLRPAARPRIIAHRGASADAPENTLSAFGLALEQGADGIELDLRLSADGWPVVMHDAQLRQTTGATGRVSAWKLAELKRLDAGDGRPAPALQAVFARFGQHLLYNLELKGFLWPPAGLGALARVIRAESLEDHVLISSFSPLLLRVLKPMLPAGVPLGLLRHSRSGRSGHKLVTFAADHPAERLVDARLMAWSAAQGLRVHAWTVDEPARARELSALGVHAIITNRPAHIRAALG
ncbi:MAG: glycerophosphodiester phosphodiesterase [Candidatus Promineifilaceae bacterium]